MRHVEKHSSSFLLDYLFNSQSELLGASIGDKIQPTISLYTFNS